MKLWKLLIPTGALLATLHAQDKTLITFEAQKLTDTYYSEGAGAGDVDGDGLVDVVYGPHWYAGPDFKKAREIYPAKPQNRQGYADNFFTWLHDFNADGWNDALVVGLPGTPAFVFENPGGENLGQHWEKHQVFDVVGNEAPHFTDLTGDGRPELVCTRNGVYGFVTPTWDEPFGTWAFHPISERLGVSRFGHGLGVGDVNGDGRLDVMHVGGWYEQPKENAGSGDPWTHHEVKFSNAYGGAEMYAYDVDADGDNDVITSLAAHDFGLGWYEQVKEGDKIAFREHLIMGALPEQNRYGLVFSEPHSVAFVDMDGDGLKDIVTGKTYYSHHEKSPQWDAGAVVYWFRLVRGEDGVDWVPHQAAADTGIGRQLGVFDLNADNLPDLLVGGMKGAHVLIQKREKVSEERWEEAQPKRYEGKSAERHDRGPAIEIDESGSLPDVIEAEELEVVSVSAGKVSTQDMSGFPGDRWSGGKQLFWSGAEPRARLHLAFDVAEAGDYEIQARFTTATDYAILNVLLNDKALGDPIDLFDYPGVGTTGVLNFGRQQLEAGTQKLTLETIGANPSAAKSYMVGMDYVKVSAVP